MRTPVHRSSTLAWQILICVAVLSVWQWGYDLHKKVPWLVPDLLDPYFAEADSLVSGANWADIHTYLPDDLMVKVDVASMAHGLESRSPLLDHVFMEWAAELPEQFKRQIVNFPSNEPAGTLVIDTANTYLYLVLGNGQAMRYGIGVGREGFTWAGAERVSRMAEWPDWHPPAEMIERQPYLPRFMAGGEGNPLGARALYLGKTIYRIHGTNQPSTIGKYVSSGCIRLTNEDIQDLYSRVQVGTRVVVLPGSAPATAQNNAPPQPQQR